MVAGRLDPPRPLARRGRRCAPLAGDGDPAVREVAAEVLGAVRKAKTDAKRVDAGRRRAASSSRDSADRIAALQLAIDDLKEAGSVRELVLEATDGPAGVDVALADDAA